MTEIDKAFRDFALDHFKHFDAYPMEFEYDDQVFDVSWVWNRLIENDFFGSRT
jgi:hypothetical protein